MSGTWGAPILPSGRDDFTGMQQPDVHPVDDLSRFVMARILWTEKEPRSEVPQVYGQPVGPMVHRYAAAVRRDMVAFRRIVATHVRATEAAAEAVADGKDPEIQWMTTGMAASSAAAVQALAMRWSDHPDFRDEWRLE